MARRSDAKRMKLHDGPDMRVRYDGQGTMSLATPDNRMHQGIKHGEEVITTAFWATVLKSRPKLWTVLGEA